MKITMYELLRLVKDGNPPEKFKYDGIIWTYNYRRSVYLSEQDIEFESYMDTGLIRYLDDEIEILEEKGIPDKLDLSDYTEITSKNDMKYEMFEHIFNKNANVFFKKINEIIDCLDHFKSKGE